MSDTFTCEATATGTDLSEYWTRLRETEGHEKDAADYASIAARLIGELVAERRCLAEAKKKEAALADELQQERTLAEHREFHYVSLARRYERLLQLRPDPGVPVEDRTV